MMSKRKSKAFIIKFLKSIGYDGSVTMSEFIINYIEKFENGEDTEIRNMNILTDFLLKSKDPEIATPETIYKLHLHYEKIGDKFKEQDFLWKAASLNHPEALCEVADDYYCDKKTQKAMELYHKAAEFGSDEAMYALGSIYAKDWIEFINEEYYDDGIEMDIEKTLYCYNKAIERGNKSAMFSLGLMYLEGDGVPVNYDEAFKLFKAGDSWYRLGICYAKGYGTPKDEAKAIECFKKDEYGNGNDEWAFSRLAYIHSKDDNKEEEFKYTLRAAEFNGAEFLNKVGEMYYKGEGTTQDKTKAFEYFTRAYEIDDGDISVIWNLRDCYIKGDGITQDLEKAFEYHKKYWNKIGNLVEKTLNYSELMYRFANYASSVSIDSKKVLELYLESAFGGNVEAIKYLIENDSETNYENIAINWLIGFRNDKIGGFKKFGEIYYDLYLAHNHEIEYRKKAIEYFLKAYELGDVDSLRNIAQIYFDDGNYCKMIQYYQKAADEGNLISMFELGKIYHNGKYAAKNRSKASELFRVAYARGIKRILSPTELAECYLKGYGVTKSDEKAIDLYALDIANTERIIISSDSGRRAKAMLKAGLKYYKDEDIKDLGKAFDYFNKASAFEHLGDMYFKGEYVEKDRTKAFECYLREGKYSEHSKEMILEHYLYEWLNKNFRAAFKWYMEVNEDSFNDHGRFTNLNSNNF